jgi:hypothetical protein
MFGGLYLDDDSFFAAKFDEIVATNQSLIVSKEKNAYKEECYDQKFRLSAALMHRRYPISTPPGNVFDGRVIVSWGIFSAPFHPIIHQTLSNIVIMLRQEYLRKSTLSLPPHSAKWMHCMCLTGPTAFTASAREMILHFGSEMENLMTVHKRDFLQFGGVFKMYYADTTNKNHYMHTMQAFNIPILHSYSDDHDNTTKVFDLGSTLNGKIVTSNGRELFLIMNGERRGFHDWDTFLALHIKQLRVVRVDSVDLERIPLSILPVLTSNDHDVVHNYLQSLHFGGPQHKNWTFSMDWPSLDDTFLSNWSGRWKTLNISVGNTTS